MRQYSARAPLTGALRERDRKRRQAEFLAMLRARDAKRRLAPLLEQAGNRIASPPTRRRCDATRDEYMKLLLDLDRTLSAEQRAHAVARLRRFGELFDSLARAP